MRVPEIPITEKYNLTVLEAAAYFNIGEKRLREIIQMNPGRFAFESGHRTLIVRHKLEEFFDEIFEIDYEEVAKSAKTKPRKKRSTESKRDN